MGIQLKDLDLLLPFLNNSNNKNILTLGVQDCYFTYSECINYFKKKNFNYKKISNSDIKYTSGFKWLDTNSRKKYLNNIHQNTLFMLLGFEEKNIYSMDKNDYEGADYVFDLNDDVSKSLYNKFDVIFDGGTFEHIFCLKQAFANCINICKNDGIIIHHNPVDFLNHGYYNFNGEIFNDVYAINNFDSLESCYVLTPNIIRNRSKGKYYLKIKCTDLQFSIQPYYSTSFFGVFKKKECNGFKIPQQGYYKDKWNSNEQVVSSNIFPLKTYLVHILKLMPSLYYMLLKIKILRKAKIFYFEL